MHSRCDAKNETCERAKSLSPASESDSSIWRKLALIKAQLEKELVDLPGFHMGALARTRFPSRRRRRAASILCSHDCRTQNERCLHILKAILRLLTARTDPRSSDPGARLINRGSLSVTARQEQRHRRKRVWEKVITEVRSSQMIIVGGAFCVALSIRRQEHPT